MTRTEMLEEIGKKKLTKRLALEISIKKWEGLLRHFDRNVSKLKRLGDHSICGDTCALCEKYYESCEDCPIHSCSATGWWGASVGVVTQNRKLFMKGRQMLLKKMKAELAKLPPLKGKK